MSRGTVVLVGREASNPAWAALLTDRGFEVGVVADPGELSVDPESDPPDLLLISSGEWDAARAGLNLLCRYSPGTEILVLEEPGEYCPQEDVTRVFARIPRSVSPESLSILVERALERRCLVDQNARLTSSLRERLAEVQQTRDRALQVGRLATLGLLMADVAHELNNPLNVILGFSDLVMENPEDGPAVAEAARILSDSANRAAATVRKLLALARARPPQLERVDFRAMAQSAIGWREHHLQLHQIQARLEVDPHLPPVECDRHQVHQVLINLLLNAELAVGSRGTIDVRIRPGAGDSVLVSVADSGPGVPPEDLARIFQPFFTTRAPQDGTGLGLASCLSIVEAHNGTITARNRPQGGLEVTFQLPLEVSREAEDEAGDVATSWRPPEGLRVLVVEDDPLGGELLSRYLARFQVEVHVARSGEEGLRELEAGDYQAVVCDLRMPGIGGEGFYERLRDRDQDLSRCVIFVTGDVLNPRVRTFLEESGCPHLTKPFSPNELLDALDHCLSGPRASAAAGGAGGRGTLPDAEKPSPCPPTEPVPPPPS